jgi:hypothetical protein
MQKLFRASARALPLLLLAALATSAEAQLISLKTVPVASGEQFLLAPARGMGMGGVSIAVHDTLGDPFVNPAMGSWVRGIPFFGSPTVYSISEGNGGGRTLPAGVLVGGERWFGGALLAFQQISNPRFTGGCCARLESSFTTTVSSPNRLGGSAFNRYAFGTLGRKLGAGVSVAASAFGADLEALDGVDFLYAGAQQIGQDGHMTDYRLGVLAEGYDGRSLELLLLHSRLDMTHEVTYRTSRWDPVARRGIVETREEINLDQTRTWGAHAGYVQPVGNDGVRLGAVVTGNYKSHPKIPNYEIMNIPRDPGFSWAYNFGLGVSRTDGPATVGLDLVYEPIWSETWADADTAVKSRSGTVIQPGGETVENDFRFSNFALRTGLAREEERWGFQLGLHVRNIHYWLDQRDNVRETRRDQEEEWLEWTPTWGAGVKFPEFQIRYVGNLTTGTGRPGVAFDGRMRGGMLQANSADFIVAPQGALTLQEAAVWLHQVSVTVPLRR